jgi:hypothetical protein
MCVRSCIIELVDGRDIEKSRKIDFGGAAKKKNL